MKRKIIIISIIILIIVVSIIVSIIIFNNTNNENNNKVIEERQPQAVSSATQLYTEEDNNVSRNNEVDKKMKTIIYGILKCTGQIDEEYNEEKVNEVLKQIKLKNGIYISGKARDNILELINNITGVEYKVDADGYLISNNNDSNNEISQNIDKLIAGDKCIILDYNIYYYCLLGNSVCTFSIEPSEYMEKFEDDNTIIMILNSKKYEEEYESKKDLVNQIINNAV